MPPPIIPQTVEQARQRDQLAGLDSGMAPDPAHELAVLRNAVRAHRDAITSAGMLRITHGDAVLNAPIFEAKNRADRELWRHVGEESQS